MRPFLHAQVRDYLERQWAKILGGRVSIQDFIFAKEVRCVPPLPRPALYMTRSPPQFQIALLPKLLTPSGLPPGYPPACPFLTHT